MGKNIVQKIIAKNFVSGSKTPGEAISVKVNQVLTQDATGTMVYLQFEALGIPKIKTEVAEYIELIKTSL